MAAGSILKGRCYHRRMGVEGWLGVELLDAGTDRRTAVLTGFIEAEVLDLLGDDAPPGDLPRSFFQIGLDSLQAVELLTRLQFALGADVPPEALDWPSIDGLAGYLAATVLPSAGSPA